MTQFSYSRVDCFNSCPFKFKLRYIDKMDCFPEIDSASNALLIGIAMHTGLDKGVDAAIEQYCDNFFVTSDQIIEECIKFKHLVPLAQKELPKGKLTFEYKLECEDFIGFIDLLVEKENGKFAIYDFKYSNNVSSYKESAQLHLYKYFFEQLNPDKEIDELGFIFIPKTSIRLKKTETPQIFRKRLKAELAKLKVKTVNIEYNPSKVINYLLGVKHALEATEFPKNFTRLCDFCSYSKYCKLGFDYMALPKNIKREIEPDSKIKIWIYGEPFTGKTYFADTFPNALFFSTNGDNNCTSPVIDIDDRGDKNKTFAWATFKESIEELKTDTSYETVVVDLVEDLFDACRRYVCDKLEIDHESDNLYKASDEVFNEFVNVMKSFTALDKNIILISHEDSSKEILLPCGEKQYVIRPNIRERIANKLACLVQGVGRFTYRTLDFCKAQYVFSGGRDFILSKTKYDLSGGQHSVESKISPANYDHMLAIYDKNCTMKQEAQPVESEKPRKRRLLQSQ